MIRKEILDTPLELDYEVVNVGHQIRYGTDQMDRPEQFVHAITNHPSSLAYYGNGGFLDVSCEETITACDHGWNMRFSHGKKTVSMTVCHEDKKVFIAVWP